jgi:hypothetical protein
MACAALTAGNSKVSSAIIRQVAAPRTHASNFRNIFCLILKRVREPGRRFAGFLPTAHPVVSD